MKKNRKEIQESVSSFFLSLNGVKYFFSFFVGSIGLIWTFTEILTFLKVDFSYFQGNPKLAIYLILIHATLIGFIALYIREHIRKSTNYVIGADEKPEDKDSILAQDLIESLKTALKDKKYLEVIRLGSVLSRPLFISGYYSTRVQIGLLVEEAAAAIENESEQMISLIDSIGWSYIELGKYNVAKKYVKHGQTIAKKLDNIFYISKSYRHLGVIDRRNKDYQNAELNYNQALDFAKKLTDDNQRNESLGGINYALSNLNYLKANYEDAIKFIDESIDFFTLNTDQVRLNLSIIKKADIYFDTDKKSEAKDLYRKALTTAENISHRLHMMRCFLGLSKIHIDSEEWSNAVDYLIKAKGIDIELNSINESKEINSLLNKLPEEQKTLYNNVYK